MDEINFKNVKLKKKFLEVQQHKNNSECWFLTIK